jgi:hypothetical protein
MVASLEYCLEPRPPVTDYMPAGLTSKSFSPSFGVDKPLSAVRLSSDEAIDTIVLDIARLFIYL